MISGSPLTEFFCHPRFVAFIRAVVWLKFVIISAMRHGKPDTPELIDLQREQSDVCDGNWMQGRYYGDEGKRVRDMLSFNAVFDIHPFEVGVNRRAEHRMHREKLGAFTGILGLGELMNAENHENPEVFGGCPQNFQHPIILLLGH